MIDVAKLKEEARAKAEEDWARKNEPRLRRYALQTPSGNIVGMGTEKPQLSRQDKRMGWRVIALARRRRQRQAIA